jgi:hypothetical protein
LLQANVYKHDAGSCRADDVRGSYGWQPPLTCAAPPRPTPAAPAAPQVGPTSVVIAHRLSTIRNADLICVVQSGALLEQGSHEELVARPGSSYAQLVRAQETSQVVY